jgi:hypothetical protein
LLKADGRAGDSTCLTGTGAVVAALSMVLLALSAAAAAIADDLSLVPDCEVAAEAETPPASEDLVGNFPS